MTFYDGRPRAPSACEVGDCGTDRATTANHDARGRTHSSYLCQSWLPSSRAALVEGGRIRPRCRVRCGRGDPNFQSERWHARLARPANQCPLYPRKRTSVERSGMSAFVPKADIRGSVDYVLGTRACSVAGMGIFKLCAALRLIICQLWTESHLFLAPGWDLHRPHSQRRQAC